jgi:hypothetical protein
LLLLYYCTIAAALLLFDCCYTAAVLRGRGTEVRGFLYVGAALHDLTLD